MSYSENMPSSTSYLLIFVMAYSSTKLIIILIKRKVFHKVL